MTHYKKSVNKVDYHVYVKNKKTKAKADKVRLNLDKYHEELGGLFTKKVIFYCMPKKTGKTKEAIKKFEEYGGPKKGQFITITDDNLRATHGICFDKDQDIVIDDSSSFIIIDDIHLLSANKIKNLLNGFGQSTKATKMVCFGTNVDMEGKLIKGARHLEKMADEVIYDSSPCYSCGKYGKTCFTKTLFEKYQPHPSDCRIPDSDDEEDGYYYERDLCFDCRNYRGN